MSTNFTRIQISLFLPLSSVQLIFTGPSSGINAVLRNSAAYRVLQCGTIGDGEVYASVKLDVTVGGNGNIRYKGNAQTSTHIMGNGNIKKID